jgi:hypothetical protein
MAIEFEVGTLEDIWFDYVLVNERTEKELNMAIPHFAPIWIDNSDIDANVTVGEA